MDTTQSFSILAAADDKKAAVKVRAKPKRKALFWSAVFGGAGVVALASFITYDQTKQEDYSSAFASEWANRSAASRANGKSAADASGAKAAPVAAQAAASAAGSSAVLASAAKPLPGDRALDLLEATDSNAKPPEKGGEDELTRTFAAKNATPSTKALSSSGAAGSSDTPAEKKVALAEPSKKQAEDELTRAFSQAPSARPKTPAAAAKPAGQAASPKAKAGETKVVKADPAKKQPEDELTRAFSAKSAPKAKAAAPANAKASTTANKKSGSLAKAAETEGDNSRALYGKPVLRSAATERDSSEKAAAKTETVKTGETKETAVAKAKPEPARAKRGKDPDVELLEAVISHMKK